MEQVLGYLITLDLRVGDILLLIHASQFENQICSQDQIKGMLESFMVFQLIFQTFFVPPQ